MKTKPFFVFLILCCFFYSCEETTPTGIRRLSETPSPEEHVTDIDGNIYKTVVLGDQRWMAENLRVTQYADGKDIPYVFDNYEWQALNPGNSYNDAAWCALEEYGDKASTISSYNFNHYGAFYTWAAALGAKPNSNAYSTNLNPSSIQGVCPDGWHIPSDAEFFELERYLSANGYRYDSTFYTDSYFDPALKKIAKAMASNDGWEENTYIEGAVGNSDYPEYQNKSGFNGKGAGIRFLNGTYNDIGYGGIWWTTREYNNYSALLHAINYDDSDVIVGYANKNVGASVRCIKD